MNHCVPTVINVRYGDQSVDADHRVQGVGHAPKSLDGFNSFAAAYGVIESTVESFLNVRFSGRRDYCILLELLRVIENKKPEQFHSVSLSRGVEQLASKASLIWFY